MASKRRLQIKNATVKNLASQIGNAMARRVRLDIADLNPTSPLANRINQVVANRQDKVAKVMSSYYKGMIREVANTLRDPPMRAYVRPNESGDTYGFPVAERVMVRKPVSLSVASGVPKTAQTEELVIESGREAAEPWRGLSVAYAASLEETRWARMPRSINFWRKTSMLNSRMAAWYATGFARVNNPNNYKVGKITKQTRLGKNVPYNPNRQISGYVGLPREGVFVPANTKQVLATYTFAVQHPRLGHVALDQILRRSYITGKAQKYMPTESRSIDITYKKGKLAGRTITQKRRVSRIPGDPSNLYRMLLPEATRPMLARFAAAVGRREMAALRKLLKRG